MPEIAAGVTAYLEVVFSGLPRQTVSINELPFFIGRGEENGNHLSLDDKRVSRKCVCISAGASGLVIEDRGQSAGIFVNGNLTTARSLVDGDRIRLGADDGCQLVFRLPSEKVAPEKPEIRLRSLLGSMGNDSADELNGLRLLLEATSLMHSELPLEAVLASMLDHAIVITHADRGMLLEPDESAVLQVKIARGKGGEVLTPERMNPSRS